ncbi:hypothetical protein C8R44DRAFT_983326 [Mycena epipterygia]|nr:hypothetical protein C8R44DRAFT_983326 [Mycena epipterygia]
MNTAAMSLSLQPTELLDVIAPLIPSPSDLLSLAFASKTLHTIIVPEHLEFREICCDARRASLWNALTNQPILAARILSLELMSEHVPLYSLSPEIAGRI